MIINIFDIVTQPLQDLYIWIKNIHFLYIASVAISALFVYGMYRAFRSIGMNRHNAKKWSNRVSATVDVVQNLNDNKR